MNTQLIMAVTRVLCSRLFNFRATATRGLAFFAPWYIGLIHALTILTIAVIYNRSFRRGVATRGTALPSLKDSGVYNTARIPDATCFRWEQKMISRRLASLSFSLSLSKGRHCRLREPLVSLCVDFNDARIKIINDAIKISAAENLYPTGRALAIRSAMSPSAVSNDHWHLEIGDDSMEPNEIINPGLNQVV